MKADDRQPATRTQQINSHWQHIFQRAEFIVYGNPQRLKYARRRVNLIGFATGRNLLNGFGKLARRLERTLADDHPGQMAASLFLAVTVENIRQFILIPIVDNFSGGWAAPLRIKTHIQRAIVTKGKAAFGLVKL